MKARIYVLETDASFMFESHRTESKAKMLQIQGEVARAKARASVYGDYTQTKDNDGNDMDEIKSLYQKKVQKK